MRHRACFFCVVAGVAWDAATATPLSTPGSSGRCARLWRPVARMCFVKYHVTVMHCDAAAAAIHGHTHVKSTQVLGKDATFCRGPRLYSDPAMFLVACVYQPRCVAAPTDDVPAAMRSPVDSEAAELPHVQLFQVIGCRQSRCACMCPGRVLSARFSPAGGRKHRPRAGAGAVRQERLAFSETSLCTGELRVLQQARFAARSLSTTAARQNHITPGCDAGCALIDAVGIAGHCSCSCGGRIR